MKLVRNKKGFTIAELIVVIAIIGILFSMAVNIYNNRSNSLNIEDEVIVKKHIEEVIKEPIQTETGNKFDNSQGVY